GQRFGTWDFFGVWSLVFGVWDLVLLCSLEFEIWSLLPGLPASQKLRCGAPTLGCFLTPFRFRFLAVVRLVLFDIDGTLVQTRGAVLPGVWEFIRQLHALPEPPVLGLLTGNIRLGAEIKLRHFELWELFQTGAFGDDHEDRNQIAAIAKERGSRLLNNDLRGEQILVIGDTPRDIECARTIEARTLVVATGGAKFEELET